MVSSELSGGDEEVTVAFAPNGKYRDQTAFGDLLGIGAHVRKPIIGGNWKMNTDLGEARELARGLVERLGVQESVEVVICPPFTNLSAVCDIIHSSGMTLGAQDVFWEPKGAFTGEISSAMLQSVGVESVIVGHSERRHILNESSEIVNRKAREALSAGLKVILAIGETEYERQAGRTESVLGDQLERSLSDIEAAALTDLVLAYEPVWAIGTGLTATPRPGRRGTCIRP